MMMILTTMTFSGGVLHGHLPLRDAGGAAGEGRDAGRHMSGITFYVVPDWGKLADAKVSIYHFFFIWECLTLSLPMLPCGDLASHWVCSDLFNQI